MEFIFEQSPWEAALSKLQPGDILPAARFLTLMEEASDEELEDAFLSLEDKGVALDIQALPVISATGDTAVRLRQEHQLVAEGRLPEGLPENDPLRLYLEEVAGTPAAGDPVLLASQYAAGDQQAAERLVTLQLAQVIGLAMEYTGKGVLLLDLIQEASLGLWESILHYTDGDFDRHSQWWIRQYLAKAVVLQARASGLGQRLRQGLEDYRDVDQRLLGELGRSATLEEIAEAMHVSVAYASVLAEMITLARGNQQIMADSTPEQPAEEEEQAVEDTAYFQSRQRIMELLSTLSEQEAKLLTLRFGLEGGLPLSPEQTGIKLGMTPDEVVKKEAQALAKLRQEA